MNNIKYCPNCHSILYQNVVKTSSGWNIQYWCDRCKKDTGIWNEPVEYSNRTKLYNKGEYQ